MIINLTDVKLVQKQIGSDVVYAINARSINNLDRTKRTRDFARWISAHIKREKFENEKDFVRSIRYTSIFRSGKNQQVFEYYLTIGAAKKIVLFEFDYAKATEINNHIDQCLHNITNEQNEIIQPGEKVMESSEINKKDYIFNNNMLKITKIKTDADVVDVVNLRDMHELYCYSGFSNWAKLRIQRLGLIAGQDFYKRNVNHNKRIDYYFTLDSVKKLAAFENNNTTYDVIQYIDNFQSQQPPESQSQQMNKNEQSITNTVSDNEICNMFSHQVNIRVIKRQIGFEIVDAIDARDIFLNNKKYVRNFLRWVLAHIHREKFVDGRDFAFLPRRLRGERKESRSVNSYYFTINAAKKIILFDLDYEKALEVIKHIDQCLLKDDTSKQFDEKQLKPTETNENVAVDAVFSGSHLNQGFRVLEMAIKATQDATKAVIISGQNLEAQTNLLQAIFEQYLHEQQKQR